MTRYFLPFLFIFLILVLLYTAYIIKNEKKHALKTGTKLNFHGLRFTIPKWWSRNKNEDGHIGFSRKDSSYGWNSEFIWFSKNKIKSIDDLQSTLEREISSRKIIFDSEASIITTPEEFSSLYSRNINLLRVEGTATQDSEFRIYYDVFIIGTSEGHFYLESKSSILNGPIEGPFFEQVVLSLKN